MFWYCFLAVLACLFVFFHDERSMLHRSVCEAFFWPFLAGLTAATAILPEDSPLVLVGLWRTQGLFANGALIILASFVGVVVHATNRKERMSSLHARVDLQKLAVAHTGDLLLLRRYYPSFPSSSSFL